MIGYLSLLALPGRAGQERNPKVLVYTKNGEGFVHDNIAAAVQALKKLGQENGFSVEVSEDPSVFTPERLQQYTALIFASTNNDVFDTSEQRLAFRRYMQSGGGFIGIHSVTGTERNWSWFKQLIGGTFSWHAPHQRFTTQVIQPDHPSMQGVSASWEHEDECYFTREMYPGIQVLMAHDTRSLRPDEKELISEHSKHFGYLYPAVWHQRFDGGNVWITTLGHGIERYQDPDFLQHLLGGIRFILQAEDGRDLQKAYAQHPDDPVRY